MHIDRRIGHDPIAVDAASGGMLRRLWGACAAWRLRRIERRCMAELDDRMMEDIGRPHRVPPPPAVYLDREG